MKRYVAFLPVALLLIALMGCAVQPPSASVPESTGVTVTSAPTSSTLLAATDTTAASESTTVQTAGSTAATVPPSATATTSATSAPATTAHITTTVTATQATTADWEKHYIAKQILHDNTYQNGINVTGQVERDTIGTWYNTPSQKNTVWSIGQWGTYKSYTDRSSYLCLLRDRIDTPSHILSNGVSSLTYTDSRKSLTFTMNTYDYYGGLGHTNNESWPSLILGQNIIDFGTYFNLEDEEMLSYSPGADKIIVSFDVRMTEFTHKKLEGINACQFLSFYYVRSVRDSGFIWFRVPIFDDRGYDVGETEGTFLKDIGSGRYIYRTPYAQVYANTGEDGRHSFFGDESQTTVVPSDEWMHIEMDIKPHLEKMFEQAKRGSTYNVYPYTDDIRDLYFTGMNIGFEIHGTYNVSFEVMNHTVTTYVKK